MLDNLIFGGEQMFFFIGREVKMDNARIFWKNPDISQVVLIDRFYIVGSLGSCTDVYLPETVLRDRIQNHSIIRSQCQHIFSYGSDIVYLMMRIRNIYEFQFFSVEVISGQLVIFCNQINRFLYLGDELERKVSIQCFLSYDGNTFVCQYPFIFFRVLINVKYLISFQVVVGSWIKCDTFSFFA